MLLPRWKRLLRRYYAILKGQEIPLYKLVRSIRFRGLPHLSELSEDELWALHEQGVAQLREGLKADEREGDGYSLLDIKFELSRRLFSGGQRCRLCPRTCNLTPHKARICGSTDDEGKIAVSSWFLHYGEETPLVPSGTVFFCGCNLRCVYCQNWEISTARSNSPECISLSFEGLSEVMEKLELRGALNINLVGGDPIPHIVGILGALRLTNVNVPIVFNSNMYMSREAMRLMVDVVDLFLPDLKYGNDKCAKRLSLIDGYTSVVRGNLMMAKGRDTIIRHLVLPGHLDCCTYPTLRWIADNLGGEVLVNVMGQYYPEHLVRRFPGRWPELDKPLRRAEFNAALREAKRLGLNLI